MSGLTATAMLGTAALILIRAVMTGTDAYAAFLKGANEGVRSAMELLPALCAMLLMLGLVNASGLTQLLTRLIAPLMHRIGLPQEVAPMLLLRPLTGSGSIAALEQIYESCGVDSRAGRIASVLMGSSETIFYTMSVYLGAAGVRRLPRVVPVSLLTYLAGAALCGLMM